MPHTERRASAEAILPALLPWLTALVLLAALWVWAERWLSAQAPMRVPEMASTPATCLLEEGPCRLALPGGVEGELSVTPVPIRALVTHTAWIRLEGSEPPDALEIDFAGLDMYMGFNRFRLEKDASGVFRGEFVLPICTDAFMNWRASLIRGGDPTRPLAQFDFVTRR